MTSAEQYEKRSESNNKTFAFEERRVIVLYQVEVKLCLAIVCHVTDGLGLNQTMDSNIQNCASNFYFHIFR